MAKLWRHYQKLALRIGAVAIVVGATSSCSAHKYSGGVYKPKPEPAAAETKEQSKPKPKPEPATPETKEQDKPTPKPSAHKYSGGVYKPRPSSHRYSGGVYKPKNIAPPKIEDNDEN